MDQAVVCGSEAVATWLIHVSSDMCPLGRIGGAKTQGGNQMHRDSGVAAVATLLGGFGLMNALYVFSEPDDTRGLYSYWSATLGDAIALPVLVAALVEAQHHLLRERMTPWAIGVVGAVLGAAGGLTTQIAWLADPNPETNWTLPRPHTFTTAGYYHAAFTIAISAVLGALIARVAWLSGYTFKAGKQLPPSAKHALMIATGAITLFALLATADNLRNLDRAASTASLKVIATAAGVVAAAGSAVLWLRRKK
ncbi:hypothetical protein [Micropruina sonneratiae]|uniref:hypothetical protein n=1 Tax=Micropruina sonneratiae TaxID=2986940 RepID=UPI002226810F|nr:hypothetical protein [Micropruina sp. KQZ13P-5]MCW3158636.1 hypothetical protein [Micropruina sp. KQZ13P-5]